MFSISQLGQDLFLVCNLSTKDIIASFKVTAHVLDMYNGLLILLLDFKYFNFSAILDVGIPWFQLLCTLALLLQ